MSVGSYHACAIRTDDTVACWGAHDDGQSTPPAGTFLAVSAGTWHTCGLRSDGQLLCWGGVPAEEAPPVPTDDTLIALDGTCVIHADATIACWYGYPGEWRSPLPGTFDAVSGNCAIHTDQTLACWDDGDNGLANVPAGSFAAVSQNNAHACAIRPDRTLACWGDNWLGQRSPLPTPTVSVETWRLSPGAPVTWGARYALVPVASFDVRYRRARWDGKFGDWSTLRSGSTTTSASFPTTPGYTYCYAVRARDLDGAVSRWTNQAWNTAQSGCTVTPVDDRSFERSRGWHVGTGAPYYLGTQLRTTKVGARLSMPVSAQWVALVATTCPTCGTVRVTTGVDRWTISLNSPTRMDQRVIPVVSDGFLNGLSGTVKLEVVTEGKPVIVDGLLATRIEDAPAWADGSDPPVSGIGASTASVDAVSAGANHTCAVKSDGPLACWGSDEFMQSSAPAGSFTAVAAGEESSCGIRGDKSIDCWGFDAPWSYDDPPFVPTGRYESLSAGTWMSCAVRDDGAAVCWDDSRALPTPDDTFVAVSAAGFRACAVRTDGTIDCWDDEGESIVAPDGTFTVVSTGQDHACAVRTDKQLTCWGSNSLGQTTAPAGTFTTVSVGELFTCGLRTDGTLACWGDNHYLQASPPSGTFTSINAGRRHACAMPTSGGVVCWGQIAPARCPRSRPRQWTASRRRRSTRRCWLHGGRTRSRRS